ncbi:nitrous oxide reductase accessory protein NosL [Sporosarcina sp. GW1-11]|uniref:nitrous oxide reductase accessory protein NosL n=1 Tax=Sporosarcina sp. GW1-11 TaxID=2899126 RepID=UPI00294D92D7|nr:nitrous oxide reductase accessory protein NosL [Sporosarcina sp. GW1-11]MDV6377436.1 nitrous oxide reductase accessory protein NosL [Sporosarcina sp. GW1-11]
MKKWLVVGVLMLAGCGEKSYEPHAINEETDICDICNMSIVHQEFAGQIIEKNGDYEVFDDIGCLVEKLTRNEQRAEDIGAAFIKDADTNEWINVFEATYLYDKEFWTPMNYGVLVFGDAADAKAYQTESGTGELFSFADLQDFKWGIHQ